MPISSPDVLSVLVELESARLFVSVDGGWGVDALLGYQSRPHDDLDLVIDVAEVESVCDVLQPLGYEPALDEMPTRFVLVAEGDRRIDVHPMYFDDTGFAHQRLPGGRLFTCRISALCSSGQIDGTTVPCLSPELQLAAHTGYDPDDADRHDVGRLCHRFELPLPVGYEQFARDRR